MFLPYYHHRIHPRLKMEKKKNNNERDKICNLPDSILHHIFSFLTMEEAVRSSVLSNRWRDLWTSLPTLNFSYGDDFDDYKMERVTRFVDKVFILRDGSDIQKFDFLCHCISSRYVNTWILSALRHNVQELILDILFDDLFKPPICFFNSESLTTLKLSSCDSFLDLNIPHSMCLPSLKILALHSVELVDDVETNRFFSSCPVLESLTIADSLIHHTNLRISSLLLKHLVIENCNDYGEEFYPIDGSINLYTPNLISFCCKDYMKKKYSLENLTSLVEANIYLGEANIFFGEDNERLAHPFKEKSNMYTERVLKFLGALHNVTKLTLSAAILEVVSAPALLESNPIYRNLRILRMEAPLSGDCIHTIICLLKMCPTIETLFVEIEENVEIEVDWEVGLSSECPLNHLKCVEIREAKGCVNELRLTEILLKNAVVLDTLMIVFAATEVSVTVGERERRLVKFREKLQPLPKASSSITIMLI